MFSLFRKKGPTTDAEPTLTAAEKQAQAEARWKRWEEERVNAVREFRTLMKRVGPVGSYVQIPQGEHPQESDEVWIEASSGRPGYRHYDLCGWIILADLRKFFNRDSWVCFSYREEIKQGEDFPAGSSAYKFARRRNP